MFKEIKKILKKITSTDDLAGLNQKYKDLIKEIRLKKITYLPDKKLASIVNTCQEIEKQNLAGIFLEAGCALGGSAILLAKLKDNDRPLLVYDVFGMIPEPTKEDTPDVHNRYKTIIEGESKGIDGDKYYGYEKDLYEIVENNFGNFKININNQSIMLVKGLIQETMVIDQPVAFAHIDVDWYEPVMTSLERIFPKLVVGGSIILDDYHDWGGCRKATDEYLRRVSGEFKLDDNAGSLKITKKSNALD